jgi:diguanylate cyclase (GGDEF)-like protein
VHLQDVTSRKASEQAAADSRTNLRAVGEVIRQIQSGSDARQTIVDAGRQLADASHVALIEPNLGDFRLHVTAATDLRLLETSFPVDASSVVVEVYRSGRSVFFPDPPADPTVSSELREMAEARSTYLVPVRCADVVTGVLAVAWASRVPDLDDRRVEAVTLLVYHAGVALRQAALVGELEALAMRDTLTLLPNRRGWDLALGAAVAAARRSDRPLTVALADLDAFKAYNDANGHPAGDELLRQVACSTRETLREGDVVARWGGEEFALALPNCPAREAEAVLERVRHAMPFDQTCSIGFATWDGRESADALMARVDAALYAAKRSGRNRVVADGGRAGT